MKGIILAGGSGTRLYPLTQVMTKQLQAVYDKPMIYYPLCTLMLGGIKDILIISSPGDIAKFEDLLGDGSRWGLRLKYKVQEKPEGIAQAFIIGSDFIGSDPVTLILGDNLFYGYYNFLRRNIDHIEGATIFGYYVDNPKRYGVVEFDADGNVIDLEEKPQHPKSNYAVTGLYIYDAGVVNYARDLQPSARGELEITDLNLAYLRRNLLKVKIIGRGVAWLDTGTPSSLLSAAEFVATLEKRQGLKFGCPEEVALRMRFITADQFEDLIHTLPDCAYRQYLRRIKNEATRIGAFHNPSLPGIEV